MRTSAAPSALNAALRALVCLWLAIAGAGCRQDMHDQPKYEPLEASPFFANGSASRPLVEGTIPRGHLKADAAYYTGAVNNAQVTAPPFPITARVLDRGEERYNIYCAPCHDRLGTGRGMIVQRGFRQPPSFHTERLQQAPAGHLFQVITNGFGTMADYRASIDPSDRWAIVAYVRALQLSQHATLADVPDADRDKIRDPGAAAPPQAGTAHD